MFWSNGLWIERRPESIYCLADCLAMKVTKILVFNFSLSCKRIQYLHVFFRNCVSLYTVHCSLPFLTVDVAYKWLTFSCIVLDMPKSTLLNIRRSEWVSLCKAISPSKVTWCVFHFRITNVVGAYRHWRANWFEEPGWRVSTFSFNLVFYLHVMKLVTIEKNT